MNVQLPFVYNRSYAMTELRKRWRRLGKPIAFGFSPAVLSRILKGWQGAPVEPREYFPSLAEAPEIDDLFIMAAKTRSHR
jgi:hypothetical protein